MKWGIWQIFTRALESLKIGTLMGSFCSKLKMYQLIYPVIYKLIRLQGSFVSWQWKMMRKLKRNWLVSSKLTRRIWQILTQTIKNLKNFHFNGLLLTKVCNVWARKVQASYVWFKWILWMRSLKKSWLVLWKMKRGIWQIFSKATESLKIGTLMGSFYSNVWA